MNLQQEIGLLITDASLRGSPLSTNPRKGCAAIANPIGNSKIILYPWRVDSVDRTAAGVEAYLAVAALPGAEKRSPRTLKPLPKPTP